MDVVGEQSAAVLQLYARKYQPLLVRGDALYHHNLLLDNGDGVWGIGSERECPAGEGLHEYLHAAAEFHLQSGSLLYVVVGQSAVIESTAASAAGAGGEHLPINRHPAHLVDLLLDHVDGVRWLHCYSKGRVVEVDVDEVPVADHVCGGEGGAGDATTVSTTSTVTTITTISTVSTTSTTSNRLRLFFYAQRVHYLLPQHGRKQAAGILAALHHLSARDPTVLRIVHYVHYLRNLHDLQVQQADHSESHRLQLTLTHH
mmetsp:Transcript_12113/g.27012  ORF Transcript_12113/g.27012 Transcript_12113/m.27012 type:complete len:258 (+) Transcript_12113:168-941(+)|eukprot:CAMPEP_0173333140 /NCGR_PEP_ID=MMETSP1144-20121109/4718_1 /TAXON_ID=483371 /ORGANISM="non described non described, Strain CCMP2298" /LENGTH=257 /DNA_ID=CAMNT_0014278053 /DNA_START=110 /DNA_END=883 /DNA_ORIENTATION=+